jgi:DNA-binding NtrC family response regulator
VLPSSPSPHLLIGVSPAADALRSALAGLAAGRENVVLVGEPGTGKSFLAGLLRPPDQPRSRVITLSPHTPEDELRVVLFDEERRRIEGMLGRTLERLQEGDVLLVRNPFRFAILGQTRLARFLIQHDPAARRHAGNVRVAFALCDPDEDTGVPRRGVESLRAYVRSSPCITIPPLRERREDIPHFVRHFLVTDHPGRAHLTIPEEVMARVSALPLPDNVREIRHIVHDAVAASPDGVLRLREMMLDEAVEVGERVRAILQGRDVPIEKLLEDLERAFVRRALIRAEFNRTRAAALLGLTELHIRYRMKKHGLSEPDPPEGENSTPA